MLRAKFYSPSKSDVGLKPQDVKMWLYLDIGLFFLFGRWGKNTGWPELEILRAAHIFLFSVVVPGDGEPYTLHGIQTSQEQVKYLNPSLIL